MVVPLRLSGEVHEMISEAARIEHLPMSNFISSCSMAETEKPYCADYIEINQIRQDKALLEKIEGGEAEEMKSRPAG